MGAYEQLAASFSEIHKYQVDSAKARDSELTGPREKSADCSLIDGRLLIADGAYLVLECGHGMYERVAQIFSRGVLGECMKLLKVAEDHHCIRRCLVFRYSLH